MFTWKTEAPGTRPPVRLVSTGFAGAPVVASSANVVIASLCWLATWSQLEPVAAGEGEGDGEATAAGDGLGATVVVCVVVWVVVAAVAPDVDADPEPLPLEPLLQAAVTKTSDAIAKKLEARMDGSLPVQRLRNAVPTS